MKPSQRTGLIRHRWRRWFLGPGDDDDRQVQCPRRNQLGAGHPAGVLGHQAVDVVLAEQITLCGFVERSACGQQGGAFGRLSRIRAFDAANDVMMRSGAKRRQFLPADGQKDMSRYGAKRFGGANQVGDLRPAIPRLGLPSGAADREEGNAGRGCGLARVMAHTGGERMGRIDHHLGAGFAQVTDKAGAAAEAAHPVGNRRQQRRLRAPGERQHGRDVVARSQRARERRGFGGATKDQQGATMQTRPQPSIESATLPWLAVIGIGEDGIAGLSDAQLRWLARAELVVGGRRHLELARSGLTGSCLTWPSPMEQAFPQILAARGRPTVVLASGDPLWFGIGAQLVALVPAGEMVCLPGLSALALACARLGWSHQSVATISFCGRPLEALRPLLQPGQRILALSAGADTPALLAAYLRAHGFGPSLLHVLQALGGPNERAVLVTADQFALSDIHPLNLVAIETLATKGAPMLKLAPGLADDFFEHDGQITKHEIRAVTLASLAPFAGQHLWDLGCGAGSIAIEWLLRHPANTAEGVERQPERAARALRNAVQLGVPGLRVHVGDAETSLPRLARPDAVFIGGGASEPVIAAAWSALREGGRLVINAVTLETTRLLLDLPARLGGTLTRLAIERLAPVGPHMAFRPAMTVTQFAATKS